jgi:hypothetical protein
MDLDTLIRYAFEPVFLSAANFSAFGLGLAAGLSMNNGWVIGGSFGFFISGATIGGLAIADRWVRAEIEPIVEKAAPIKMPNSLKNNMEAVHGIPKDRTRYAATIDE